MYNFGNHRPERLLDFIAVLERLLGREAVKAFLPLQPGTSPRALPILKALRRDLGFEDLARPVTRTLGRILNVDDIVRCDIGKGACAVRRRSWRLSPARRTKLSAR